MTQKKHPVIVMLIVFIMIGLLACKQAKETPKSLLKTYTVRETSTQKTMHFTGTIQPLRKSTVMSQMNAVVESMPKHYGQSVKKGMTIFTLNSSELQRYYNDTLTDYLKAKDAYSVMSGKFTGTEELWKVGLISKNNYLSEQSTLNTTRVTLMQATRKLSELLEKMNDGQHEDLSTLSFAEFEKVQAALTQKHNLIKITAPSDGVLLYPPKIGDEKLGSIGVGSQIKASQVLALIGDLTGISVEIDVPEVDISDVKVGMPVFIRGLALGRNVLQGRVLAINDEASLSRNANLPSFTALVEVHKLTKAQQSMVKVGMSASIELILKRSKKLVIPIEALTQASFGHAVYVVGTNGKPCVRKVKTGLVTGSEVVIESGLKAGERVLYG